MFIFGEETVIPEQTQTCHAGNRRCPGCVLYKANGGPCKGCDNNCITKTCETQCGQCGGHDGAYVGAICCKSPLKDIALTPVNKEFAFERVDPIDLKCKAVMTVIGGKSSVTGNECPYVEGWDAIAVNLRHVWSPRGGWYSQDLKDYMMIPKEKKLILLTAMYDDVLDAAWKTELFDGFAEMGFDYWCPLVFSIYDRTANMYAWWNHKRTEYSLWANKGHFWSADIVSSGFEAADEYKRAMERVPNVIINCQLMGSGEVWLRRFYGDLKVLHNMLPPGGTIWLTGVGNPKLLKVALVAAPGRAVYTLSTVPWIVPHKGRLVQRDGKIIPCRDRPKKEILFESQRNFIAMVEDCYEEAGRLTNVVKPAASRYPQKGQASASGPRRAVPSKRRK